MSYTATAYKWRITNAKYIYITDEFSESPFIYDMTMSGGTRIYPGGESYSGSNSGNTYVTPDEVLIKRNVSVLAESGYCSAFQTMLGLLATDEDGQYLKLLDCSAYFKDVASCTEGATDVTCNPIDVFFQTSAVLSESAYTDVQQIIDEVSPDGGIKRTFVLEFGLPQGPQGPQGEPGTPGTPGDPGTPGVDGISPRAVVRKVGKTSTIVIRDKNGETTAQVKDGDDGADGKVVIDDDVEDRDEYYLLTSYEGVQGREGSAKCFEEVYYWKDKNVISLRGNEIVPVDYIRKYYFKINITDKADSVYLDTKEYTFRIITDNSTPNEQFINFDSIGNKYQLYFGQQLVGWITHADGGGVFYEQLDDIFSVVNSDESTRSGVIKQYDEFINPETQEPESKTFMLEATSLRSIMANNVSGGSPLTVDVTTIIGKPDFCITDFNKIKLESGESNIQVGPGKKININAGNGGTVDITGTTNVYGGLNVTGTTNVHDNLNVTGQTKVTEEVRAKVNDVPDVYLGCPIGSIILWAGASGGTQEIKPLHWLKCDGSNIAVSDLGTQAIDYDFIYDNHCWKAKDISYRKLLQVIKSSYGWEGAYPHYGQQNYVKLPHISDIISNKLIYIIKYE